MYDSFHDLETFSEVPIKDGAHRYAERAELLLWAFAVKDGPVRVWQCQHEPMPDDLAHILADDEALLWFHNGGMFDFAVLQHCMPDWIKGTEHRWRDTMVQAYMHSLPGSLDKLGTVLQVPLDQQKMKAGKELMRLFCQPRPKNMTLRRATRDTHPQEWQRFVEYAGQDIVAMRACLTKMPRWNATPAEWDLWRLDLRMNYRGIAIDRALVDGAIAAADRQKEALAERTVELTDGDVRSATQRDEMLRHLLAEHGVDLPDLKADTLERRMADPELPGPVRELLAVRMQATTTSVSKFKTLARAVSADGRIRGTAQFRGAGRTGRWAHRLFQPGNLPRPNLDQDDIELGIEAVKNGCEDLLYANVMELLSNTVRSAIVAPPGRKLCVADLSNIEGRGNAWLCGEQWKLRAFSEFDAGRGDDLYKLAYAKAFATDPAGVTKPQRQIGKVMELMLGYQGGVGAFITGAAAYGINLAEMAAAALPTVPADVREEAENFWQWSKEQKRPTYGLAFEVFIACDSLKRLWRRAHPRIESYWRELEDAVRSAIQNPGTTLTARRVKVRRDGAWLRIVLPSGRALCYPAPRLSDDGSITYTGLDQYTRQWKRLGTYGGKLLENITQAVACDQLAGCLPAIEAAGYLPVLLVHDEDVTETPDSPAFSAEHLAELMTADLGWNEGLPLAAAGFETYRYRKD